MILLHWNFFPTQPDWFDIVDDYGNIIRLDSLKTRTWWNAYRFANGQSFEESGMRSIDCVVDNH